MSIEQQYRHGSGMYEVEQNAVQINLLKNIFHSIYVHVDLVYNV